MPSNKLKIAVITIAALAGILLNHSSWDIAAYSEESVQQQEAIERGQLKHIGPVAYNIEFDGSVVNPVSGANFLRTLAIDAILALFATTLIYGIRKSK